MNLPLILLALPLISAAVILLVTRKQQSISALIGTASTAAMFVASLLFLAAKDGETTLLHWATVPGLDLTLGATVDQLSRGMMFVVTTIGLLVHIFSLAYMKDDAAKSRYFGNLSLFMFSMTGIVLADNFAMMFIFWELVGVSSYLLIGHWYTKNSAADAAKKAFCTNRVGDFGFMAGILLVWGLTGSITFSGIEAALPAVSTAYPALITAAVLCVFAGAAGKSAQAPLHVWLPDAMEGPTPVSALIHAATMVAAGVYMLVRVFFLVEASATAAEAISWIGGITALLAALMATQQDDIKKILAYSTLSQLGYMVMAVGLLAGEAAMFHLFTHAFFKALLFLGSGAIIYACHHEQNIWKMGGLWKKLPITAITFLIGTAALVAFPGTSGFWSKELILEAAYEKNNILFWIAVGTAFLTAFYMTRAFVVTFFGKARSENADHAKEVPMIMWLPLAILAVPAVIAGYKIFYGPASALHPTGHEFHLGPVFFASIGTLILGVGLGFALYAGRNTDRLSIPLFKRRFFLDEIYQGIIAVFHDGLATISDLLDELLVDGLISKGGGGLASGIGNTLRRLQSGNLQGYAFLFGAGVIALIYFTVFSV